MSTWMAVLLCSVLWLSPWPAMAGVTSTPRPAEQNVLTRDQIKQVQERLKAEGVDPGPADGVMHPQTEAALRQYQQKQGLPVSGAADEATLKQLQIELPTATPGAGR
jgi:peptidoglycan hydrolase-like protein with peptidoglycan-binding domain